MMMKLWNAASWSNFSAQIPARRPIVPRMAQPASANPAAQNGCSTETLANGSVTTSTPAPTARPRTIDATTYAPKNSTCDSGVSSTNTMLPVTFDWIRLDELLANAFCSIDIMTSPGTRNAV